MSRNNEQHDSTPQELINERVDVGVPMVAHEDTVGRESTILTGHEDRNQTTPPTLPTGDVIDAKNTLQSFANLPSPPQPAPVPNVKSDLSHPTLPNGEVITGKNTLQTFDLERTIPYQPPLFEPPVDPELKQALDDPPENPVVESILPTQNTVVAVAVQDDFVFAEVSPDPVQSSSNGNPNAIVPTSAPWYQSRSFTLALLTILAMSLALGLGLYFGLAASDESNQVTDVPTMAPSSIDPNIILRANVLTSYINNITLSNQTIAPNGTSPESKALAWLIANDTTLNTSRIVNTSDPIHRNAVGFRIRQRYPLLVMWFQQTDTEKWAITTGWLEDSSECTWYGIKCESLPKEGQENAVTQILFDPLISYVGIIPIDAGLLTNLKRVEIKRLIGTLPKSIGQWTAMTHFDMSDNIALTGALPDGISNWTALTYFDVSGNDLSGALSDSIGQWTALSYFDVSYNYGLTGTLPASIGQWTSLSHFDVSSVNLAGTLPYSIDQWTALTFFNASSNGFNGTLPASIGQWIALTYFDMSNNSQLNGALPVSIGQWTALSHFDVSHNFGLSGSLPESIGLWNALTYFDVSWNDGLSGTFPDSISQWSFLTHFDARRNGLTGTLADSIGQWTALIYFDADFNGLSGTLPNSIGQWNALKYFSVTGNDLNGTIPQSIGNWSLIERASFQENSFVGTVPNTICPHIDPNDDYLAVDCTVNCTCCTRCNEV